MIESAMIATAKIFGLFPGQGSQKVGMGKDLYEANELAREYFALADTVLGFALSKVCFDGPAEPLTATEVAQPAILTVSVICYAITQQLLDRPVRLSAAAGHSLGEYSALVAAGAIDYKDAVLLVHKRGKYMQEAVPAGKGMMVAVLGMEHEKIREVASSIPGVVEIANINSPGQIVVAGERGSVGAFCAAAQGAKTIELPVSAPFHCSLMRPAADKLALDLNALNIKRSEFPIYTNVDAAPVTEPEQIRSALKRQVCGSVRWVECLQMLIKDVAPRYAIEFGYGNVLSGLLKKIDPAVGRLNVHSLESAKGLQF